MIEMLVDLDFACCACFGSLSVTVKCSGKGLIHAGQALAAVSVPCPHCHAINQLQFDPQGIVHAVQPVSPRNRLPTPSIN